MEVLLLREFVIEAVVGDGLAVLLLLLVAVVTVDGVVMARCSVVVAVVVVVLSGGSHITSPSGTKCTLPTPATTE